MQVVNYVGLAHVCVCVSSIIWVKLPYAWEKVLLVLSFNHTGETQEDESSKSPIFIGNLQYHLMTIWKIKAMWG